MILKFDRPATRKLELWAISKGHNLSGDMETDACIVAELVMDYVNNELVRIRTNGTPKVEVSNADGA